MPRRGEGEAHSGGCGLRLGDVARRHVINNFFPSSHQVIEPKLELNPIYEVRQGGTGRVLDDLRLNLRLYGIMDVAPSEEDEGQDRYPF